MTTDWIELDGSLGEGGGQILRSCLTLSLLTGNPFRLHNIRARRPKPGLQPQHLQCVRAAAEIGQGSAQGASLQSCELSFQPGKVRSGKYTFNIGTAGSTGLLLQTVYLPLILRGSEPSEITLMGGTHVTTSPSFHFLDATWRAYLAAMGLKISLRLDRPGFYPRGGGIVRAFLQPSSTIQSVNLPRRKEKIRITGTSAVAGLDNGIARRQARRACHRLEQKGLDVQVDEETWQSNGPGSALILQLDTSPAPTIFVGLGARGKPAEKVADETVSEVIQYLAAGASLVDVHSADQIVLPLALADGPSEYTTTEISSHLRTNISVINRFLDRPIVWEGEEGQPGRVLIG